ncbi:hypothetical protein Tco_0679003 [Tanacetum coccineum]|uniref:Uncharacterized protein n=1 Tax=Tanacetum coccineum TaxID=301880 RepID=A0ABQ4XGW3_9ASTR
MMKSPMMPHKIKQYNSLSDLEKEHTKSVYLRNEEDKRRGVEYVMSSASHKTDGVKLQGLFDEKKLGSFLGSSLDDSREDDFNPVYRMFLSIIE